MVHCIGEKFDDKVRKNEIHKIEDFTTSTCCIVCVEHFRPDCCGGWQGDLCAQGHTQDEVGREEGHLSGARRNVKEGNPPWRDLGRPGRTEGGEGGKREEREGT